MTNVMPLPAAKPATEVTEKAKRRRHGAEYKARIVRKAAACTEPGELGALLRREGLYSSHLATWRAQARRGELAALEPKARGPKPAVVDVRDKRIAELERELAKVTRRAERAEARVEVQKKKSRFGEAEDARAYRTDFFAWYNDDHHHSSLAMFTPADVHYGHVEQRLVERQAVLDAAFDAHPERFPRGRPIARRPAREVWINKPTEAPGAGTAGETPRARSRDAVAVTGAPRDNPALH